jgi:hypothetical protein
MTDQRQNSHDFYDFQSATQTARDVYSRTANPHVSLVPCQMENQAYVRRETETFVAVGWGLRLALN